MTTYNKTAPGAYEVGQLTAEINGDPLILISCMSISSNASALVLEFAAALSGAEETQLDVVIAAHIPTQEIIDVSQLPFSDIGIKEKIAVHTSYKPNTLTDTQIYAMWTGCGDDMGNAGVGEGPRLEFQMTPGNPTESVIMEFHPDNGRVWLHEGYVQFTNAGFGDCMTAEIRARGCTLQTSANLDLVLTGNWVSFAPGGAGTGTHGFADANLALIPQTFTKDGEWDYDEVNGLVPNLAGTGGYRIAIVDKTVHKFINEIPFFGTSSYVEFSSDETSELRANYYIRLKCYNNSDTTWNLCAFIECYRERTAKLQ